MTLSRILAFLNARATFRYTSVAVLVPKPYALRFDRERALHDDAVATVALHPLDLQVRDALTTPTYVGVALRGGVLACFDDEPREPAILHDAVPAVERALAQLAHDEAHVDRTEFALSVATALGEGLELERLLQRLVDLIAPRRAVVASVWTRVDDGHYRRIVHAPRGVDLASGDDYRGDEDPPPEVVEVFAGGRPLQIDDYSSRILHAGNAAAIRALGLEHGLWLPIHRDGMDTLAVLALARTAADPFSPEDVIELSAVARQSALMFENARLYAETNRLRRAAEAATLAKDQFLSQVSHDLRNPLGSILGWATLLRQHRDPAQLAKGLEVIERNARAQTQLIEDLLDVSRIVAGKLGLELALHDVASAIDMALDPARIAAEAKRVALRSLVEPDVGAIIVDGDRFRQVVWNLLSNAVKFTPAGGTVTLVAKRDASQLVVSVTDTGRGIDPAFLPRVFGRFEQAEQGGARTGGLGLGLTIVKHLVELHGGSVEVDSPGLDRGATFTVRLPIRASVPLAEPTVRTRLRASTALENVSIVVVDDEDDAREIVAALLRNAGAQVTTTGSVDEALAAVMRERPAAIVSDIGMPGKDGHVLARAVRALPASGGGSTPMVALTAFARAKDRIEALAAGFNAHVAKPVEPDELVVVLTTLLR